MQEIFIESSFFFDSSADALQRKRVFYKNFLHSYLSAYVYMYREKEKEKK